MTDEHTHKNRQQCTSKPNPTIHEKIVHHDQVELRDVKIFQYLPNQSA